jgi:hypothetical protein
MKIGAENKKEVTIMAILLAVLLLVGVYNFRDVLWGSSTEATPSTPTAPAPQPRGSATVATAQDTDSNLRTDILIWSRGIQYEPGNRNPFAYAPTPLPTPIATPRPTPVGPPTPTPIPPPPPIPLIFYGFTTRQGEPKRVFLAEKGGEGRNFVAGLNEIVDRRYKIVQIQTNQILVQDMLNNNTQPIPFTPRDQR